MVFIVFRSVTFVFLILDFDIYGELPDIHVYVTGASSLKIVYNFYCYLYTMIIFQ